MLATECELLSGSVKGYWLNLYRRGHSLFFRTHQFIRLHLKWDLSVPFSRFLSVQLRTDAAVKNDFGYRQLKCSLALAFLLGLRGGVDYERATMRWFISRLPGKQKRYFIGLLVLAPALLLSMIQPCSNTSVLWMDVHWPEDWVSLSILSGPSWISRLCGESSKLSIFWNTVFS